VATGTWAVPVSLHWRAPSTCWRRPENGSRRVQRAEGPSSARQNHSSAKRRARRPGRVGSTGQAGKLLTGRDKKKEIKGLSCLVRGGIPSLGDFSVCWAACWLRCRREVIWLGEPSSAFLQDELSASPIELDCKTLFDVSGSRIATEVLAVRKHFGAV